MSHTELKLRMSSYAGLVLPSYPETFGLVYIEALSAGLPVIHSRNSGIDGYFEGKGIALAVDHRSPVAIAQAMANLLSEQLAYKLRVQQFQRRGGLRYFSEDSVSAIYQREIENAFSGVARL
jgi:glycosyltransferase involved in cell wall biosynthesis